MTYETEGYIEKFDSNGKFTFCGAEGFCLEKGKNTYNILWPKDKSDMLVARIPVKRKFNMSKGDLQKGLLLLALAKTNHSKVKLVFAKGSEKKLFTLEKITLI